jgi:hypothetical protein
MLGLAWFLQHERYRDHLRQGGRPASVWNALGLSLFCAVITFTGIGLHLSLFPDTRQPPAKVRVFDPNSGRPLTVYYQDGIDEETVRRAGKLLAVRRPGRIRAVYLSPRGNRLTVSCAAREADWEDPTLRRALLDLELELSETLDGWGVRVEFCDEELTRRRQIR